jgi:translation initiation factor 2B subunit (eIF-2B alpha/beta/delta family)
MSPESLHRIVEEIARHNRRGATALTRLAAEAFARAAREGTENERLRNAAVALAEKRPMMASIFDFSNRLLFFLDEAPSGGETAAFCLGYLRKMEEDAERVVNGAAALLRGKKSVFTHSFSSLACEALLRVHERGRRLRVYCSESRPANEGVELARRLCEAGVEVTLATDAAAAMLIERAEAVLLGADGIGAFGLVHKAGTRPLLLAAGECGIPAWSLAPLSKFWPAARARPVEPPRPADEVAASGCFGVYNRYFDITPTALLRGFVTEEGVLKPEEAEKKCRQKAVHPMLSG